MVELCWRLDCQRRFACPVGAVCAKTRAANTGNRQNHGSNDHPSRHGVSVRRRRQSLSCRHGQPAPDQITLDVVENDQRKVVNAGLAYAERVSAAGGVPVYLAPIVPRIADYLAICDGYVFTGGDDPKTEAFHLIRLPSRCTRSVRSLKLSC